MHARAAEIIVKDGRPVGAAAEYEMHSFLARPSQEYLEAGRRRLDFLRSAMAVEALESDEQRQARPVPMVEAEQWDTMSGQAYIIRSDREDSPRMTPLEPPTSPSGWRHEVSAFLAWVASDGVVGALRALWHLRIAPRFDGDEWVDLTEV